MFYNNPMTQEPDVKLDYRQEALAATQSAHTRVLDMLCQTLARANPLISSQLEALRTELRDCDRQMGEMLNWAKMRGAGPEAYRRAMRDPNWIAVLGCDIPADITLLEPNMHDVMKSVRLGPYFHPEIGGLSQAITLPEREGLPVLLIDRMDKPDGIGNLTTGFYSYNPDGDWRNDQVALLLDLKGINWMKLVYIPQSRTWFTWLYIAVENQWLRYTNTRYLQQSVFNEELKKVLITVDQPVVFEADAVAQEQVLQRVSEGWVASVLGSPTLSTSPSFEQKVKGRDELYWVHGEALYTPEGEEPQQMKVLEWVTARGVLTINFHFQKVTVTEVVEDRYSPYEKIKLKVREWETLHPYTQHQMIESLVRRVLKEKASAATQEA